MKTGQIMTSTALTRAYDRYWSRVLRDGFLDAEPTEKTEAGKRKPQRYKVLKDLPMLEEYRQLKNQHYTTTVGDLVSDAFSEIQCLSEEMQEWYDNLPEGFQQSERGERVQEAADALSYLDEVDVPEEFQDLKAVYIPAFEIESRRDRASEVSSMLQTAAETIRQFMEDESKADEYDDGIADQLEETASSVDDVEFPGMYG